MQVRDPPPCQDVDFDLMVQDPPHLFIDTVSYSIFVSIIIILLIALFAHFCASFSSPPLLVSQEEFTPLTEPLGYFSTEVNLTLENLHFQADSIFFECSLIADYSKVGELQELDVGIKRSCLKHGRPVQTDSRKRGKLPVYFAPGSNASDLLRLGTIPVSNCDSVKLQIGFRGQLDGAKGFLFRWSFRNPAAVRFDHWTRVSLSIFAAYCVLIHFLTLKRGSETPMDILLLVVGVASGSALNPCRLSAYGFSDQFFMCMFCALFRAYSVIQLEMIRNRSLKPDVWISVYFACFFAVYVIVDSAAASGLSFRPARISLIKKAQMGFDFVYVIGTVASLLAAWIFCESGTVRRLVLLTITTLCSGFVTIIAHVWFVLRNVSEECHVPELLYGSVHVTLAATILFLLRRDSEIEYKGLHSQMEDDALAVDLDTNP